MRNAREEKMWDFSLILITTSSSFRFSENCFQSAPELRLLTFMFSEEKILRNSQEILKSCSNLRHLFHNNCFYRVVATLSEKTLIKSAGYNVGSKVNLLEICHMLETWKKCNTSFIVVHSKSKRQDAEKSMAKKTFCTSHSRQPSFACEEGISLVHWLLICCCVSLVCVCRGGGGEAEEDFYFMFTWLTESVLLIKEISCH